MKSFYPIFCLFLFGLVSFGSLHADTLDPLFGKGGVSVTKLSAGLDRGEVVALQSDGKIIVAGIRNNTFQSDIALLRFLSDGTPDLSFGKKGRVITNLGGSEKIYGIAVRPDNKIVVGGFHAGKEEQQVLVAQYTQEGKPDPLFGEEGIVLTLFEGKAEVHYLLLQPDGKILVTGFTVRQNNTDMILARYLHNGNLDPDFGDNGKVVSDFGSLDRAYGMALKPDGTILVSGGILFENSGEDCVVIGYTPNGDLDWNFGGSGISAVPTGNGQDICSSVAVEKEGNIFAAGFSTQGENQADFLVARFKPNGILDESFAGRGWRTDDIRKGIDIAHAVTPLPSGHILVAGEAAMSPTPIWEKRKSQFALLRYLPNGTLDSHFGQNGKIFSTFSEKRNHSAEGMILQPNGDILLTGYTGKNIGLLRIVGEIFLPSPDEEEEDDLVSERFSLHEHMLHSRK